MHQERAHQIMTERLAHQRDDGHPDYNELTDQEEKALETLLENFKDIEITRRGPAERRTP